MANQNISRRAGVLGLAFLLSAPCAAGLEQAGPDRPATNARPGHTYWKYSKSKVILDLWECPETGICAKVHSVDVHDPGAIEMAKFMWQRDGKFGHPVGPVTDAEVAQVCGYPQVFRGMKIKSGSLQGDFRIEGSAIYHALIDRIDNSGTSNGVTLERRGEDLTISTHVHHIAIGPFAHVDHLTLVPEPAAACTPPLPQLNFN